MRMAAVDAALVILSILRAKMSGQRAGPEVARAHLSATAADARSPPMSDSFWPWRMRHGLRHNILKMKAGRLRGGQFLWAWQPRHIVSALDHSHALLNMPPIAARRPLRLIFKDCPERAPRWRQSRGLASSWPEYSFNSRKPRKSCRCAPLHTKITH